MRLIQHMQEVLEHVVLEAQRLEIEGQVRSVEDAHHHALAMDRRRRGDPQVDFVTANGHAQASVLRQPPLGDVERRPSP